MEFFLQVLATHWAITSGNPEQDSALPLRKQASHRLIQYSVKWTSFMGRLFGGVSDAYPFKRIRAFA